MLKMKKIMITGMAFLIAMTALAGCGNVTETETTEETSAADGNQEISVSSGGNLTIPVDELTENCSLLSCKCRWHGNGSDRSKDFGWNYPYRF